MLDSERPIEGLHLLFGLSPRWQRTRRGRRVLTNSTGTRMVSDLMGLFGLCPCQPCQLVGTPKSWRTFCSPAPQPTIGVKLNWRTGRSLGEPNSWRPSKYKPSTQSTPFFWLGSFWLKSKQALYAIPHWRPVLRQPWPHHRSQDKKTSDKQTTQQENKKINGHTLPTPNSGRRLKD